MPTSSIFANFYIDDPKAAEAFVNALEASENDPNRRPVKPGRTATPDEVRELMQRRRQRKEKAAQPVENALPDDCSPIRFDKDHG